MRTQTDRQWKSGGCNGKPWPPKEYELPDSLAEIEAGRPLGQRSLFDFTDDSRAARVARIVANVPGVTTASRMMKKGRA
jgi:hypothetical protein